jgi:hypothetical protein
VYTYRGRLFALTGLRLTSMKKGAERNLSAPFFIPDTTLFNLVREHSNIVDSCQSTRPDVNVWAIPTKPP